MASPLGATSQKRLGKTGVGEEV